MPKLSIIVPAYNVADFIKPCLDSVLAQTFSDFELIVIDDGSTDATPAILKSFGTQDSRLHIFRQKNAGLSAARNFAIAKATGEYFILLDGDDFLTPTALQSIMAGIEENHHPDLLRFQLQDFYEDGHTTPHHETGFSPLPGPEAFSHLSHYHYLELACAYAYRTDFFRQHAFRYAEGRLAEDFGLTPLVIASSSSVASISDICYNYRQRAGSIVHDVKKLKSRVNDAFTQLLPMVDALSRIPGTKHISHYVIVSFFTLAARLPRRDFFVFYRRARKARLLSHIHPSSLKNLPRSLSLKFTPCLFYQLFHVNS